jgi:leucyl-tRNA synthetase
MFKMDTSYQEMLITSDLSYQKWTQWLFLKLKEHGIAYKKDGEVNWCTSCETVLAREQVKGDSCERCSTKVEQKVMNQWYFKITDYKDRLIKNLDWIDYPKSTINAQRMWLENLHDWCVFVKDLGVVIPVDGETDTLDTFVDSSFYYVRYCDPNNDNELCSKDKYKQVDVYVGGSEHACMRPYSMQDLYICSCMILVWFSEEEPFKKVIHQGMILNNGEKMSKTKGNVINPDDYQPSILRFYMMFIGHYFDGGSWDDKNINGITRLR